MTVATAPANMVNRPFAGALVDYAMRNERVVCVTNDLTKSVEADLFRDKFPERYFSLGMAEQNLAGVLSGLAREGFEPFYPSFAVFTTRRPYEQILLNIAYPNLPVRLMGFLPGLTTPGGVTHQATDDLSLMCALPNMTVFSLSDATDVEGLPALLSGITGPVYCRLPRGEVPRLFDQPLRFNEARLVAKGSDVLLLSTGAATRETISASVALASMGIQAHHLSISTLKPFTDPAVPEALREIGLVVTVENHLTRGGLGTAVAEVIADGRIDAGLRRVGIRDTFTHGGSPDYLFRYYQIDAEGVVGACGEVLGVDVKPAIDKLGALSVEDRRQQADSEAL